MNSDGWGTYIPIVEEVFGANVDYAQAIKDYGPTESGRERYSPSDFVSIQRKPISGNPIPELITTSHVERTNLTTRTRMRRFTRLAIGFSKKKAYLAAALAIHFYAYNFMTIHSTIRCTPAMCAEVTNTIWTWADLFAN